MAIDRYRRLAYWIRTPSVHRKQEKAWEDDKKDAERREADRKKAAGENWYNPTSILDAGDDAIVPISSRTALLDGKGEILLRTRTPTESEPAARPSDESSGLDSNP